MIAVVIEEPGKVAVKRLDDPAPGPTEAVIDVEACGICGTDIHVLEGDLEMTSYPIVPGHEFCGEVVAVGSEVENIRAGDFVAVDPSLYCGHCRFCRAGRFNLHEILPCASMNFLPVSGIWLLFAGAAARHAP